MDSLIDKLTLLNIPIYTNIILQYTDSIALTINKVYYYIPSHILYNNIQYKYNPCDNQKHIGGGYSLILFYKNDVNHELAVKYVNISSQLKNINIVTQELYLYQQIIPKMQSIIEYYGYTYCMQNNNIYLAIILEKMTTDLFEYQRANIITIQQLQQIIKTVLYALHRLHIKNIIYCDLKPENILVKRIDNTQIYKLCDFNCSYYNKLKYNGCGTLQFNSPEQLKKQLPTDKTDIFSLGLLVLVLATNADSPYIALCKKTDTNMVKRDTIYNAIKNNLIDIELYIINNICIKCDIHTLKNIVSFCKSLLQYNKEDRPTVDEILLHPLLQG